MKQYLMKMKDLNQVLNINYISFIYYIYICFPNFYLDLEQIEIEIPELCKSPEIFDEEWIQYKNPDLPEISDDDDDKI